MDIGMMLKFGGLWAKFSKNHPKFPQFIKAVQHNGFKADTIIDVKITFPDTKEIETNIKVTQDDLNIIEELKKLKG